MYALALVFYDYKFVFYSMFDLIRYRKILPSPMVSRHDFNLWSVLKNCIGKELSKITMPVVFNEPLTFLQRMTEYMEYARLLRMAAEQDDPVERLKFVAGTFCALFVFGTRTDKTVYFIVVVIFFALNTKINDRFCCVRIGVELGTPGKTIQSIVG